MKNHTRFKFTKEKQLLDLLDLNFVVEVREINEVFPKSLDVDKVAEYLANLKL